MRWDVMSFETLLGSVVIATSEAGLHALEFDASSGPASWRFARRSPGAEFAFTERGRCVAAQVGAYFGGDLSALDEIVVAAPGTEFEQRVWASLRRIPPGTATTYGTVAAAIGRPGAARAVGRANAMNPVAVVVPCHRVVGADGALTGYAFGLERKRLLLAHERAFAGVPASA